MNLISLRKNRSSRQARVSTMLVAAGIALSCSAQSSSATQADNTSIILVSKKAGATPFIRRVTFKITPSSNLKSVQYTIQPKPGSVTRAISTTYTAGYLASKGLLDNAGNTQVPVFGLYDGYNNGVTFTYLFNDNSSKQLIVSVPTNVFNDPCNYGNRTEVIARSRSTSLSYDFMLLKDSCGSFSPAIMDTDGALRWVGSAGVDNVASAFIDNGVYIGSGSQLLRIELDGTVSVVGDYSNIGVTDFHHNIDPGKTGLFVEVDTTTDVESVILEINKTNGAVHKLWNMATIISRAMRAGGDDPSAFVRPGQDWFHNNSVTYRASDDSVLFSSRENFV
ncbi:MAG TPA: aryl-sulfate sulfotransferase, partial [Ktedonobacteraceae bacterium]|nr:aryl-sulfate sulfotransferase [Ktedonobacteraceae bacterium]